MSKIAYRFGKWLAKATGVGKMAKKQASHLLDKSEDYNTYHDPKFLDKMWDQYNLDESYRTRFYNNPDYDAFLDYLDNYARQGFSFEELFTGSSSASRNMTEAKRKMYSYWSDLAQEQAENEYNSEEQKVGRERAAGLNPALLGTGDVAEDVGNPESAYPFTPEDSSNDFNALSMGNDIASSVIGAVMSIKQGFADLAVKNAQRKSIETDTTTTIQEAARRAALESFTEDDFKSSFDESGNILPAALSSVSGLSEAYGFTDPNHIKIFNAAYSNNRKSILTKNKTWSAFVDNSALELKQSAYDAMQEYGFVNLQLQTKIASLAVERHFSNLQDKLLTDPKYQQEWLNNQQAQLEQGTQEARFEASYWEELNNPDAVNSATEAKRQEWATFVSESLNRQKAAMIKDVELDIVKMFYEDYSRLGPTRWDATYSPLNTKGRLYKEARKGLGFPNSGDINLGGLEQIGAILSKYGITF